MKPLTSCLPIMTKKAKKVLVISGGFHGLRGEVVASKEGYSLVKVEDEDGVEHLLKYRDDELEDLGNGP